MTLSKVSMYVAVWRGAGAEVELLWGMEAAEERTLARAVARRMGVKTMVVIGGDWWTLGGSDEISDCGGGKVVRGVMIRMKLPGRATWHASYTVTVLVYLFRELDFDVTMMKATEGCGCMMLSMQV